MLLSINNATNVDFVVLAAIGLIVFLAFCGLLAYAIIGVFRLIDKNDK